MAYVFSSIANQKMAPQR